MSKFCSTSLLFLRRASTVATAENVKFQGPAATVMRKVADSGKEASNGIGKDVFWMRDPKTGNWIPENRFDEVDVVELREKLLPKKRKF